MRNKPSLLKRTLTSIVLATALLFPAKATSEEIPKLTSNPVQSQFQEIEDYANLFGKEFEKDMSQRSRSIEDLDKIDLIRRSQNPATYDYLQLSPNESRKAGFFIGESAVEGLKSSTDQIPWVKALKNDVSKSFNYELYLEGKTVNEKLTETLEKQAKKEKEQIEGTTRINLLPGKQFKIETSTGIKTFLDSKYEPAGELYTSFNNLYLLGYDFRRARITLNNKGEVGFSLQRRLDYDWLGEVETAATPYESRANVSISKEIKRSNSRIKISAGEEKEKGTFFEFNFGTAF